MQGLNRSFFVLSLLMLTALSPLICTTPENTSSDTILDVPLASQAIDIEHAASHWSSIESSSLEDVELTVSTGILRIAAGEFDPLASLGPSVPDSLMNPTDYLSTGLGLLQLHTRDGEVLEQLSSTYALDVLDHVADEGWLVRLPNPPQTAFDALQGDERVRWIGAEHPGWRIEPSLLVEGPFDHLAIVPASDLALAGLELLSLDMVRMGAEEAWCGVGLCEAKVSPDLYSIFIENLARDGRLIWVEATTDFIVHNAVAGAIVGVDDVAANATFSLDGSGETLAITDTGLDQDHPDILGRIAGVYTNFGLDPSPSDTNTGHGTHIALSAVGDGSGDSSAQGIAPSANVVMYALEHDPTGVFGRIGSIYDLLNDAEQKTARIAINAWGSNGNYGHYTADSRSVDLLVNDKQTVLPLFSVGDRGAQGASQVTAPGTAKNVLAVGTSQTGSLAGTVANISSLGPSLDGRIKPDIVAPGINICSGLAEEAKSPAGFSCGTGSHSDGSPLYMTLSGSSHATSIAGGSTALVREFLREQVGLNSPSASLIKAAVINGAKDLGASDIPNAVEGWGQLDLQRTIIPTDGSTSLTTFYDDYKPLKAGFGLLYAFDMDPSHGIDITLAWSDVEGSANAGQGQVRLVNDLDLVLVDPSGQEWFGNDFSGGYSTSTGTADSVNNVERIKVAPGTLTSTGQWLVKVLHRSGIEQNFALVVVADATPNAQTDLATYNGSIVPSSLTPLKDDIISLQIGWVNQGTSPSGTFHVILEDLTANEILFDVDRPSLQPGLVDSLLLQHQFTTTGIHSMRLSIDTNDQVSEMNDANAGIDNNIWLQDIEVTALGVRVVALDELGDAPVTPEDRAASAMNEFDVLNETGIDIPIHILHEGTGQQAVTLSVTNVQMPQPGRPDFLLAPDDVWSKTVSEPGPYVVQGQGEEGDFKQLTVRLENEYADLSNPEEPRYARAGTFVVDITARYQSQPTVSHTQRITIVVPDVTAVNIGAAGISGLSALPGESTGFVISVMNIGNSPGQYTVSCSSENRWQVMLGSSNSSTLEFEPLNIKESLPMYIRIFVPPVSGGLPAADSSDTVTCWVTSPTDSSMNFTQSVEVLVLAQQSFDTDLYDDIGPIGPAAANRNVMVDSGQQVNLNHTIENTGNTPVELTVSIQPSNANWPIQVSYEDQTDNRKVTLSLDGGEVRTVQFILGVPLVAEEGESNNFVIRTEYNAQKFTTNSTVLVVKDDLAMELLGPSNGRVDTTISSELSFGEFTVTNTGNAALSLNWSNGLAPDGWTIGFANPSTYIEPREERTVRLGFLPPINAPSTDSAFELVVTLSGFNNGRMIQSSVQIDVAVLDSAYANISVGDPMVTPLSQVVRGETAVQSLVIRNDGNIPLMGSLVSEVLDAEGNISSEWTASSSLSEIDSIAVGESVIVDLSVTPSEDAEKGLQYTTVNLTSGDVILGQIVIETTVESARGSGGFFSSLPLYLSIPLLALVILSLSVVALRIKKRGEVVEDSEGLIAPDAFVNPDREGTRREQALDIGLAADDLAGGEVSSDEIAAALAQSLNMPIAPAAVPTGLPPMPLPGLPPLGMPPQGMPPASNAKRLPPLSLPPIPQPTPLPLPVVKQAPVLSGPPLPPSGLPVGWTMEQWQHYGQQWLDNQ